MKWFTVDPVPTPTTGVNAAIHSKGLAGKYCPGMASTYLVLEELTVAMEGVAKARESILVFNDLPTAQMLLARADAALALAAGRGSGARVATLIDALLAAKQTATLACSAPMLMPFRTHCAKETCPATR